MTYTLENVIELSAMYLGQKRGQRLDAGTKIKSVGPYSGSPGVAGFYAERESVWLYYAAPACDLPADAQEEYTRNGGTTC